MLRQTIAFICFFFLLDSTNAEEGFFPISEAPPVIVESFLNFPEGNDCGSVRIHKTKQYYLTALHCVALKRFEPSGVTRIGSPLNSDELIHYSSLKGKKTSIGNYSIEILENGNCITGFSLDVMAQASSDEIAEAARCLKGDWVIFERIDSGPKARACAPVFQNALPARAKIIIAGGSRVKVKRNVGLSMLTGLVYSSGSYFQLNDLVREPQFPTSLSALWQDILNSHDIAKEVLITNADVINGMSGGPIFYQGELAGVTSVAFLPTFIYDYPGITGMAEGYNYGIHGGIAMENIFTKKTAHFFNCR